MAISAIHSRAEVLAALKQASGRTGVDFDYLLATARRESGLDPRAKAQMSSAAGLFQFIDQTWLSTLKAYGARHGLGAYADAITVDDKGRHEVADPALREEILALRLYPEAASAMAAELARESARSLEVRLGQKVDSGILYAAHFLGLKGAAALIEAAAADPEASAASLFPRAAAANRSVFFDEAGAPRSVSALLARLGANLPDPAGLPAAPEPSERQTPHVAGGPSSVALAGDAPVVLPYGSSLPVHLSGANATLRLTPDIIRILAAFDPPPHLERRDDKS
jgi:hypothetical protein